MNLLPGLANTVYQNFFNPEWDENGAFFTYKPQETVMIVVGMMFKIEGPDGQHITPSDIAQVMKYRDQRFFADVTGNMVRDFFRKLERNKDDPMNPYGQVSYSHRSFLSTQRRFVDPKESLSTQY